MLPPRSHGELRIRPRADSGIDLRDARPGLGFDGEGEPSATDLELRQAYADWLARFEPPCREPAPDLAVAS
jgi:hypothetical protein